MKKHVNHGKSVLGTSLAVALLATSIVGCGSGTEQADNSTQTQDTTQPQATEEKTSEAAVEEAAGEPTVIKYGTHWVAGLDPNYVDGMPKGLTAASGIDALVHSLEAYVSCMATNFTNSNALESIKLVFKCLLV